MEKCSLIFSFQENCNFVLKECKLYQFLDSTLKVAEQQYDLKKFHKKIEEIPSQNTFELKFLEHSNGLQFRCQNDETLKTWIHNINCSLMTRSSILDTIAHSSTSKRKKATEKADMQKSADEKAEKNNLTQEQTIFTFPKQISISNEKIKIVGIDLGTSRCCAAVNRKNFIATVHLDNTGERLLPSYVAYDEENVKCGKVVVNRLRHFSRSTIFDSKRIIGRHINDIEFDSIWPFRISQNNGKVVMEIKKCDNTIQKSAEDVASDLLRYMKQKSEDFQGAKLHSVVITVPAAFSKSQKESTARAAKLAGWDTAVLLPEPIAAAFAYFNDQTIPENENILVFDLGGGTLDVCIFKIENNQIRIISNTGDTKLGGRDFDNVLFNYFKNQLGLKYNITLTRDKKYKLILDCQRMKEDLSAVAEAFLNVDEFDPNTHEIISISRDEFQNITKPLLNKLRNTVFSALHNSKFKEHDMHKILLVGGGSRMPMIKTLLKEIFPEAEQCIHENPDEVVAIGAAYYAYSIFSQ